VTVDGANLWRYVVVTQLSEAVSPCYTKIDWRRIVPNFDTLRPSQIMTDILSPPLVPPSLGPRG
jgi:hypothetical protein